MLINVAADRPFTDLASPRRFLAQLGLCFVEARLRVQAIFMMRLLAGAVLGAGAGLPLGRTIAVAAVWELTVASAYLADGVMDIVEDRLNGSRRPIARGDLSRTFALLTMSAMAAGALLGACLLGWPYLILVPVVLLIGLAYCVPPVRLKRWSGSAGAVVTVAGLLTFVAGAAANEHFEVTAPLAILATAMSLWMGLVGALAKDFSDLEGDSAADCHTTAVLHYARAVRLVVLNALTIALGFAALSFWLAPVLRPAAVLMSAGAVAIAIASVTLSRTASRSRRRRPYSIFMITQFAVHLAVIFSVTSPRIHM